MKYLLNASEKKLLTSLYFRMTRRLPFPRWQRQRIAEEHAARAIARIEAGEAESFVHAIQNYVSGGQHDPKSSQSLIEHAVTTAQAAKPVAPAFPPSSPAPA